MVSPAKAIVNGSAAGIGSSASAVFPAGIDGASWWMNQMYYRRSRL
ncbi:hypothetical protein [Sinobaca sp. H24]|nr:hypothetical protein [Sinobaca sp. H24]